ncbi:MAG: glycosyltransferase [bacterium]
MKVLLVHPGATWAVADVWRGVHDALKRQGVEIVEYALDGRIQYWGGFLTWAWKHNKGRTPKPSAGDYLYMATAGILERALCHQVDWVLIICGSYMHPEAMKLFRRAGLRVATILTESPYDDERECRIAGMSDVVWTNERASVETFKPHCERVYYWQHAYEPERHHAETQEGDIPNAPAHDVVFVATGFIERVEALSAVNWDGIDFGLYGAWGLLGSRHPLRKHLRDGVVSNAITAALYRKAKIGLNIHRTSIGWGRDALHVLGAESMNPRCYELAACGSFFITDYRPEVGEIFGDVVPTFSTPAELEGLIRYYLAHGEERARRLAQAQALIQGHTFDARVADLIAKLKE